MEREDRAFLNSPVIQKNTPIKRLGLSRKRKSSGSDCSPLAKIQASGENLSKNTTLSDECHTLHSPTPRDETPISYDKQIELLKRKISEDEEKLKNIQQNKKNIRELEDLIELWKNGCKNAFLHFIQLLKEKEQDSINCKAILSKLGIWETMFENFECDSELSLLD